MRLREPVSPTCEICVAHAAWHSSAPGPGLVLSIGDCEAPGASFRHFLFSWVSILQASFQPLSQGFSLLNWVGGKMTQFPPTQFKTEKPWERGWLLFLVDPGRPAQCLNSGVIYDRSWGQRRKRVPLSRFLHLVSFLDQLFCGFYLRFPKLGFIRPGFRRGVCGEPGFPSRPHNASTICKRSPVPRRRVAIDHSGLPGGKFT